ncbi:MAG: ATP-binding cassette domain-containing protein, partial [Bacteroidota bacterium]
DEINDIKTFVKGTSPEDMQISQMLIIDGKTYTTPPFKHVKVDVLDGFIGILYLKLADTYFIKYRGTSEVYLNGVPLKARKKLVFGVGSTIRSDRMRPIYYGDIVGRFLNEENQNLISFEAKNISYQFKNGKLGLRDVNIAESGGNLVGLMGASGAGKSTLLNVLNGHDAPSEGKVIINGIDINKESEKIEGVIGFVPQDDLLIEELTVYQNLYYATKLCFDHISEEEAENLVRKTLNSLGLIETKDLKVGSPLDKTISGGQRKRLNIGLELLREPAVLFVDEPTSGLSSRDSENIMNLLKELTLKGKLIFVVIHQPSSDIFKMFDKLVILDTGGYQVYYGNPVEAVVYFKEMINLVNSDEGECERCGNVNPEQIFNIIETRVINEYGNFTNERKIAPEQWNQLFKKHNTLYSVIPVKEKPHSTLKIPNKLNQLKLFAQRDLLSKFSNRQYLIINLLEAPLLALILAYIVRYYNAHSEAIEGYIFGRNVNIPAYLFMSIIVALFMGLTVSAEEIIRDRKILKREAFLHLSRSSYLFSKILILFSLSAIQTLSFVLIGNLILDIEGMLLNHWFILFSTSCMANMLGLNISSAFNSAVTIYILIPILLIPQLVLSGVVVRFDKLNPHLSSTGEVPLVGDLMTSRWAFEAAMVSQFKDNEYEEMFYPYEKVMAEADYKRIYYIPTLKSKLEYNINSLHQMDDPATKETMASNLKLLRNELRKELGMIGEDKFNGLNDLTAVKFDSIVYRSTFDFLETLRKFYTIRYNNADNQRDKMVISMTDTPEKREEFDRMKNLHRNETVANIVRNQNETHRIIEKDGHLIQKIFPIYKYPDPKHLLDYRSQFYVPQKHLFGAYFGTFGFNLMVIWMMSLIMVFTLYFDSLRKLIEGLGRFTSS